MTCNTTIDYSQVVDDKILPFLIELDLNNSVLDPTNDENQRFCYIVTGIGADTPKNIDLSHMVIGICDQIRQDEIVNITVKINGVQQSVHFGEGGNVELKTPNNPDISTGCTGLKFDFELNKVNGVMNFCFELTSIYPIGNNDVCLFGGGMTAEGLELCSPICKQPEPCISIGYQRTSICVPVTITPFTKVQPTTTICCGNPIVMPGSSTCIGTVNGSCNFFLSQKLCIAVPVEFGAIASVDAPSVICGSATDEDICTNCAPRVKKDENNLP